jgi:hypothetical protein
MSSLPHGELPIFRHPDRCRCLYSKGMFINAGMRPGEEVTGDGNFWCARTQTILGPDRQLCDGDHCLDRSRACHESL